MFSVSRSPVRKVVSSGTLALLLLCAPLQLAAQEKEAPRAHASALDWFTCLWSDLTAWLASEVIPPQTPPGSFIDGSCAIDPDGCPGGK